MGEGLPSNRKKKKKTYRNSLSNKGNKIREVATAALTSDQWGWSRLEVQCNVSLPPGVIALLCMSGYLIWRNWKRKNTKSMNFDNPVYRKTTEEEDEDELHIGRTTQIGHVYPAVSIPC